MALDPKYILLSNFHAIFRDKDTGLPLSDGYILFSEDEARTIGKIIYTLDGTPPAYNYVPFGFLDVNGLWRVNLSDSGQIPASVYAYPFDTDGNIQLYFYQVFNSDGVFQYSAEAIPNTTEGAIVKNTVDINFVPNGQFLLHNDIPAVFPNVAGQITQAITPIAYGGWTFERPTGSLAKDIVLFERFGSPTPDIEANPRYAARVINEAPAPGDTYKDLRVIFTDVNKFASTTEQYTFAFTGVSNTGGGFSVDVILIKNYGTGGSTQTETNLGTITLTGSEAIYTVNFAFGDNSSKTIGPNDDDFLQLAIRFPLDAVFDGSVTDIILTTPVVTQPVFPVTTDSQFTYESIAAFQQRPTYDRSNWYLPLVLTPTGIGYDDSSIGSCLWTFDLTAPKSYLPADGNGYQYNSISSDEIPYSRLASKWYDGTNFIYKFGTGYNFVTADVSLGPASQLRLSTNSAGAVTNTADGTTATGFTFATIHTGATTYANNSWINFASNAATEAYVVAESFGKDFGGNLSNPSTNIAGWVITYNRVDLSVPLPVPGIKQSTLIHITSVPTASQYIWYETITTTPTVQKNMLWFKVNGVGTQPVTPVADVYIEVDILSTYTTLEVAKSVNEALNGRQISTIVTTAGNVVPAASYWTFDTSSESFYVWYTVDGVGSDPMVSNKIGIKVDILSTDTAVQVSNKTTIEINKFFVGTPSIVGQFPRIYDPSLSLDYGPRYSTYSNLPESSIGNFEFDTVLSHVHTSPNGAPGFYVTGTAFTDQFGGDSGYEFFDYTAPSGSSENRVVNFNINLFIKY